MSAGQPRTAIVTGATRGIGCLIARNLAEDGWDLILAARDASALERLSAELGGGGGTHVVVPANLSDPEDVVRLAEVGAAAERVDALVLNAGMGSIGPFADFPERRLDRLLAVNTRSAFVLIQRLLPQLRRAGASSPYGGKVVAMASSTGLVGEPLNAAYGASKAALISLCETLNTEESGNGVTATAVCPGYVATDMTESLHETVPAAEMLDPEDVAAVVRALLGLSRRAVIPQLAMLRPGPHLWRA